MNIKPFGLFPSISQMVHGADVYVFGCNIQGNDKEINNLTTTFFSTCSVKIHEYDSDVILSISPIMIYTFFKKKKTIFP